MPRLAGDDRVEDPSGGLPGLERGDLDLDPASARRGGHSSVDVDTDNGAACRLKLAGDDAGAHSDVEDVSPGELVDEVADARGRVTRSGPVVALGVRAERLRPLAVSVRLLGGEAGWARWVGWCGGHPPNVGGRDPHTSADTVCA